MKKIIVLFIIYSIALTAYSRVERDLLQNEAEEINLAQTFNQKFF